MIPTEPTPTTDDVLAIMWAHNGYLVIASPEPLEIGCIPDWHCAINAKTPVRIIAVSSHEDYLKQNDGIEELLPPGYEKMPVPPYYNYYYRVEAVD